MLYTVVTGWNGYCNWVDEYAWVPSSGGGGPPETGGPGGSPGGTTTVPPTLADSVFIEVGVDAVADTTTPNCPANPTELRAYKWCHPVTMGSTDLQRINAAIQRMAGLGYVCATLAMAIDSVVQAGRLHLFDPEYPHVAFGGFASTGGAGKGFIGLSTAWTRQAWDHDHTGLAAGERMTLQAALAHEADHLLNNTNPVNDEVHLPGSLVLTVHTKACSDVLL
jgi:hypothetical protein